MVANACSIGMTDIKNEYIAFLSENKKCSKNTLMAYIRDIDKFYDFAKYKSVDDFSMVDAAFVESYKEYLRNSGLSSPSISRALSALRSLMQHLVSLGIVDSNPAREIHNDKAEKVNPSVLSSQEIDKLLAQPSGTDPKSVRDKAILEILYATGIKVSELIDLNVSDVNFQLSVVKCVKGDKERVIPIYPLAAKAVADYINGSRKLLVFNQEERALFVNVSGERMTRQGLWKIIKAYAESAKISSVITPHTLRHSFAAHLLQNGADIHDIQEILGHTDISSTQRYAQFLKDYHKKNYMKFHPRA